MAPNTPYANTTPVDDQITTTGSDSSMTCRNNRGEEVPSYPNRSRRRKPNAMLQQHIAAADAAGTAAGTGVRDEVTRVELSSQMAGDDRHGHAGDDRHGHADGKHSGVPSPRTNMQHASVENAHDNAGDVTPGDAMTSDIGSNRTSTHQSRATDDIMIGERVESCQQHFPPSSSTPSTSPVKACFTAAPQ